MEIGSAQWKQLIRDGGRKFGIKINVAQLDQFALHAEQMQRWNQKINLTAIRNPFDIAVKHYLDAIVPVGKIPLGATLLDVGSGAGFPGIAIKIMRPDVKCTLIDASRKKVIFLQQVIRRLGLKDLQAQHIRAEDMAGDPARQHAFDIITARALSAVETLVPMVLPMLSPQGMIMAFQGKAQMRAENSRVWENGAFWVEIHRYRLPYIDAQRSLLILKRQ